MVEITKEEMRQRLGNITQLRDLLFGDKMQEYEQQFQDCFRRIDRLESDLVQYQSAFNARLAQLQTSLTQEIRSAVDSLEKKFKYLQLTTHETTNNLQQEIQTVAQTSSQRSESLKNQLIGQTNNLQENIRHTQEILESDLRDLRQQVFTELEKRLSELTDGKVAKADLAEILFDLCLKLKRTPSLAEARETSDEQMSTDLLLPEQTPDSSGEEQNNKFN